MMNIVMCLTANLLFDCTSVGQGGIQEIKIGSKNDFSVTSDDGTGEVTAVTPNTTEVFYKVEFLEGSAVYTETFTEAENRNGGSWAHELSFTYPAFTDESKLRIQELAKCPCGLLVYFKDNNGREWFYGIDPSERARLTANEGTTGGELTSASQETVTITGNGGNKRWIFTGTIPE